MSFTIARAMGIAAVLGGALLLPAHAENPDITAAARAITTVSSDPGKSGTFCAMLKDVEALKAARADEAKVNALAGKIEAAVKTLGPEFYQAWTLRPKLNPAAIDAVPYFVALNALLKKCAS